MHIFDIVKVWTKAICCALLLFCAYAQGAAQEAVSDTLRLSVFFERDLSEVDPLYMNNAENMASFRENLAARLQDPETRLEIIIITATASPEGAPAYNQALSERRAQAIKDYLAGYLSLDPAMFRTRAIGEDWFGLYEHILNCGQPWAQEAIDIIQNSLNRKQDLMALRGGEAWAWMDKNIFPELRGSSGNVMAILTGPAPAEQPEEPAAQPEPQPEHQPEPEPEPQVEPEPQPEPEPEPAPAPVLEPETEQPILGLYIYNNLALDALLIANLGFEADLSNHWSVAVPVFHSGWNWFGQENTKFRCLGTRPEIRWWPFSKHMFYVGAHGAVSYFNVACQPLSDTYRYQDTDGKCPLYGGGLDLGLRIPLSQRWFFLVSAGAGVYQLDYDKFYLGKNGRQAFGGIQKPYFGPDFLQVSVVWRFNKLSRKER